MVTNRAGYMKAYRAEHGRHTSDNRSWRAMVILRERYRIEYNVIMAQLRKMDRKEDD